jgi:hypothetical protein
VVRGGCTRWHAARVMVELVGERPERAVHDGLAVAGMVVQWGAKGGGGRNGAPRWGECPL